MAHILIVDHEESILKAMAQYIVAHGCTVDTASELEEAQALLANIRYHLVVADLRLSGIHGSEGLDLVAMVRKCCPTTRVIVLTANGSSQTQQEVLQRGADAVLHKSMPLAEVAETAIRLLGCAA